MIRGRSRPHGRARSASASCGRIPQPDRRRQSMPAAAGPVSRRRCWWARTGRTTICSSPSAAPPTRERPAPATRAVVAAPVGAQRADLIRLPDRVQIAVDVGAAERVDRLLRVADQDQRGVPVEGAADDLPLDRVGVLELVDEHDPVAIPEPLGGLGAVLRVGERVAEPGEHVVVGEQPRSRLRRSTSARTAAANATRSAAVDWSPGPSGAGTSRVWTALTASSRQPDRFVERHRRLPVGA